LTNHPHWLESLELDRIIELLPEQLNDPTVSTEFKLALLGAALAEALREVRRLRAHQFRARRRKEKE
jgi:hypothetical protein